MSQEKTRPLFDKLLEWSKHNQRNTPSATERDAARDFQELFAEDAPCGFEMPKVFAKGVTVNCKVLGCEDPGGMHGHATPPFIQLPQSWGGAPVNLEDGYAMVRMLLQALTEVERSQS